MKKKKKNDSSTKIALFKEFVHSSFSIEFAAHNAIGFEDEETILKENFCWDSVDSQVL